MNLRLYHTPLLITLLWLSSVVTAKNQGSGFIGLGIRLDEPECAFACSYLIAPPLNCTLADVTEDQPTYRRHLKTESVPDYPSGPGWKVVRPATKACKAHNEFYLQTLAYCFKSRCSDKSLGVLDSVWPEAFTEYETGEVIGSPPSYTQVLSRISAPPTQYLNNTVFLNYTALIPDKLYISYYNGMHSNVINEMTHGYYSFVLFITGAVLPIVLSLLRLLPWPSSWVTKFKAFLIDPPLVDSRYTAQLSRVFVMPTRGQAIFIAYLWIVNIVLSATGFETLMPNVWYGTESKQIQRFLANRLGVLAFSNLPLVILYAGRNTLLLWLTNWSRTTFLLLHRWTAMICTLHAALHAIIYLYIAHHQDGWYDEYFSTYWIYGTIAMIAFTILIVSSIKPIRERVYEMFIAAHIVLSILSIVGSYRHVVDKYGTEYGYQNWILLASAIWAFDRVIRVIRLLHCGLRRAFITPIDDEYYRIDIPGVSAVGHVYLHFPTISKWRVWESHPFSVASVTYCNKSTSQPVSQVPSISKEITEVKATETAEALSSPISSSSSQSDLVSRDLGIVLLVRRQKGLTSMLADRNWGPKGLPILVEGSYGHSMLSFHEGDLSPTPEFPNLICIAGGVGITGVLPALARFNAVSNAVASRKLYWGVRTQPLVQAVEDMLGFQLSASESKESTTWQDVQVTLSIGERLNLRELLQKDLQTANGGGTVIVVCGPSEMTDDVRTVVSALSRHNHNNKAIVTKLVIESFDW